MLHSKIISFEIKINLINYNKNLKISHSFAIMSYFYLLTLPQTMTWFWLLDASIVLFKPEKDKQINDLAFY